MALQIILGRADPRQMEFLAGTGSTHSIKSNTRAISYFGGISPIHQIFGRSSELGVFRLTADQITQLFGFRKHKRLLGKFHSMLEKVDHGHHVLRVYLQEPCGAAL